MGNITEITFLGTSASPSYPVPFCSCKNCREAIKHGQKNIRKKTSLLINRDLLIDLGPDTPHGFCEYGIDSRSIKTILQTHAHEDHFDPELLVARHGEYGSFIDQEILLAASLGTWDVINKKITRFGYDRMPDNLQKSLKIKKKIVTPYVEYIYGDYSITGFPANHDRDQESLIYSIKTENGNIFYGTDTSIIDEEVWTFLKMNDYLFDLLILDHTYGIGYDSTDHLGHKDFIDHIKRFKNDGLLREKCSIYGTHISHEGIGNHDDFNNYALKNGYQLAFDGLKLNIRNRK